MMPPPPPPPLPPPPPPPHLPSTQAQHTTTIPLHSSFPSSLSLPYGVATPVQTIQTLGPPSSLPLPPMSSSLPQPPITVPSTHSAALATVSLLGAPPPQSVITGPASYHTYQTAQHQNVAVSQLYASTQQVPLRIGTMIAHSPAAPVGQPVFPSTNTPPAQFQQAVTTPHLPSGTYSPSIPLPPSQSPYHPPPGHTGNWMRH